MLPRCLTPTLALAVLLPSGCQEDTVVETADVFVQTYEACPRPKVDVLLVIDDSPSMAAFADTIGASLSTIGTIFDNNQDGEDIRIAITTTSVPGRLAIPRRRAVVRRCSTVA